MKFSRVSALVYPIYKKPLYWGLYRIRASTHLRALCANIAKAHLQDIVCVCARALACVRVRVRLRACMHVRICACVCERERLRTFASSLHENRNRSPEDTVCVRVCDIYLVCVCIYIPRIISWNFALSNSPVWVRCLPEILKRQ